MQRCLIYRSVLVCDELLQWIVIKWVDIYSPALGSYDRASWAKCEEREKSNKMQNLDVYY